MLRTVLLLFLTCAAASAQSSFVFWPGAEHDPALPTFRSILGYDPGDRITWHAGIMRYLEALQAAAPGRVRVVEYGRSWEGRKLVYAIVASDANFQRLDEIRGAVQRLADPRRTPEPDARRLMANLPAVIWLGYGVHGNEISSPDAALLTAYHLLAARNNKMVDEILANVVVLLDPTQNPDGRDRFVHNFEQSEGLEADPSPVAAEHNEPWPGGRTNHYYFDMNRDWFALTQPETRGRIKALLDWYPLVFVDLHEMGSDSTYYFAPEAIPYNPHLTADQKSSLEWFGRNNARWFDQFGFNYFTREVYDAFYPGYGASWPSFYGSIAMTYEQASARGLTMRRTDETVFHFRDTVRQHFVASISTAETAARQRQKLLENFYRYRQTAIEEGQKESVREYILPRHGDTAAVDKLAVLLADQGVEVRRAASGFRAAGREFPAGSYAISLAQPAKRLIRTLLDPQVGMEEAFVKEQERRRQKKLPDEIYDVTAWALPMLYNVEAVSSGEAVRGNFEPVAAGSRAPGKVTGQAAVAYLAPWGTAAAGRFLAAALREGLRIHSTDKPFTQNGRKFPGGTLILRAKDNPSDLAVAVARLAASSGADVFGTDSGWVEEGVNFGSRYVVAMRKPAIGLAWDRPTASGSAGWTRFVLERQFGYPVTVVRTNQLATADLSRFHVVILPDGGGYADAFGARGAQRLKDWVAAGGTLIGIGGAVSFLADPKVALLAVAQENLARAGDEKKQEPAAKKADEPRVPGKILASEEDYLKAIRPESELPDAAPGAIVRARVDTDHWLTAGVADSLHVIAQGRAIFTPIKLDKGVNAAVFAGPDKLLASGHLWEENRKQLAYKPFVVAQREGRGNVIAFTADPNFRAFTDGLNVLFLNAVFRGAAHSRPAAEE